VQQVKSFLGLLLVFGLCVVLFGAGCARTARMLPTSDDGILGTPGYYQHPRQVVFAVAQEAARELGLTLADSAHDQSYFIATRGATGLDWGTMVGVYFTDEPEDTTLVVIRTDPRFAAYVTLKDFSTALHASIRSKLATQAEKQGSAS
jgi:membrane protease subunit (stomatin/prohibitin family)